jgi:O-antigen ligase
MEITARADRSNFFSLVNTWILCAVFLVFASIYGFSFERGNLNTFLGADTNGLAAAQTGAMRVIFVQNLIVYTMCLVFIFQSARLVTQHLHRYALILGVLAWSFASVLWSANPSTSAVNALRMAINVLLVFCLFERYSANELQKLVMLVGSVAAFGSLLMVFAFPQFGLQSRGQYALGAWEGIFGQKNLCGQAMLILLLPAFFVKLNHRFGTFLRVSYSVIVLLIIAMTRSAGAWLVTALCLTFIVLLKVTERMRRQEAALVVMGAATLVLAFGIAAAANFNTLMYALGKDPTMTGRTVLWKGLLNLIGKRPLCGYGFMAFWQGLTGPSRELALQLGWLDLASAENGALELLLELGLIGLLLYIAVFLRAVKDAFYCFGRGASPAALWYISVLFYVLVANIESGFLLVPSNLICILPVISFIGLRQEAERASLERLA